MVLLCRRQNRKVSPLECRKWCARNKLLRLPSAKCELQGSANDWAPIRIRQSGTSLMRLRIYGRWKDGHESVGQLWSPTHRAGIQVEALGVARPRHIVSIDGAPNAGAEQSYPGSAAIRCVLNRTQRRRVANLAVQHFKLSFPNADHKAVLGPFG